MIQGKWCDVLNIPEGESDDYEIKHMYTDGDVDAFSPRTLIFGHKKITVPLEGRNKWHSLKYSGGVWMTDLPIEQVQIDTQTKDIEGCKRVLVGGLGLGYALSKFVLDYGVDLIDIVEINENVINLVWPHIHKDVKNRCRLHQGDLFKFLEEKRESSDNWDCGFYDIWQSDGERTFHEMVMPLRRLSKGICNQVVCWNEDIMRSQMKTSLIGKLHIIHATEESDERIEKFIKSIEGNVYLDWQIPFWKLYLEEGASPEEAIDYVNRYGLE